MSLLGGAGSPLPIPIFHAHLSVLSMRATHAHVMFQACFLGDLLALTNPGFRTLSVTLVPGWVACRLLAECQELREPQLVTHSQEWGGDV